jgi:hypothetical protein
MEEKSKGDPKRKDSAKSPLSDD